MAGREGLGEGGGGDGGGGGGGDGGGGEGGRRAETNQDPDEKPKNRHRCGVVYVVDVINESAPRKANQRRLALEHDVKQRPVVLRVHTVCCCGPSSLATSVEISAKSDASVDT